MVFDGFMLKTVTAGVSPISSMFELIVQVLLLLQCCDCIKQYLIKYPLTTIFDQLCLVTSCVRSKYQVQDCSFVVCNSIIIVVTATAMYSFIMRFIDVLKG